MSTWTQIAVEGQTVEAGPGTLRYGASSTDPALYVERAHQGGPVSATNAAFGGDPARGRQKFLWLLAAAPAPAPAPTPAPQPADPALYVYPGPALPVPTQGSTDAQWDRYLAVERLRMEAARSAAFAADRVSRDRHREATDAHREQLRLLTVAMHDQPQIIQQAPLTTRALALQLMIDLPRRPSETPDELAARAVAEAEALMRATP